MRQIRLFCGTSLALLTMLASACSKPAAPDDMEQAEQSNVAEPAASVASDESGAMIGAFSFVDDQGSEAIWTLDQDGSFTLAADGIDPVNGSYTHSETDNGARLCATPDDADAGEICWDLTSPVEDGSWTATADNGAVLTVSRVGQGSN